MNEHIDIGFSQRIRLEWLERTAALCALGKTRDEIESVLQDLLRDQLSIGNDPVRGTRGKVITILLKTWVTVPTHLIALRDEGLGHIQRLPAEERIAVHWGMTMTAYPFFGIVGETVGRLGRLQENVAAAQVQQRVREHLGERETVARAVRRILRSLIDWGVLQETSVKGMYRIAPVQSVSDRQLIAWLIETVLVSSGTRSGLLASLVHSPRLFPFWIDPGGLGELHRSNRLEVLRHGLDEDMVVLRNEKASV